MSLFCARSVSLFWYLLFRQEYGAHVPLSLLDADNTTLRSLVPIVRDAGVSGDGTVALAPGAGSASVGAGAVVGGAVTGPPSSNVMIRDTPGRSVLGGGYM